MPSMIEFDPIRLPPEAEALRTEVRAFLKEEIAAGTFDPNSTHLDSAFNIEFSRKCGKRGWIGMTWPKKYGGGERSFLERYVLTEEFRVWGAPTRAHFTADRQSGPVLLKYGSETVTRTLIPQILRGECFFCIGLSEPNSGSELFAASTTATPTEGGWLLNGRNNCTPTAPRAPPARARLATNSGRTTKPPVSTHTRHSDACRRALALARQPERQKHRVLMDNMLARIDCSRVKL